MIHVLIVDDQIAIRRLIRIALGSQFSIVEAEDGVAAIRAIRRYHPEIVMLDVMMPGDIDGLQVLDAIKSDPLISSTVVAMLTARGQMAERDDALKRGADAYFIKPFSPAQVSRWVKERLRVDA